MPPGRQAKSFNGWQMFEINCCRWRQKMATVRSKKGRFSKAGVVSRAKKIGELKTSVVKGKPLIHTAEENKDEPHYHNVSGEKLFEGSRTTDLLFVIKQLKNGCTVGNCRILHTWNPKL